MCMLSELEKIVKVRLNHHTAATLHGRRKAVLSGGRCTSPLCMTMKQVIAANATIKAEDH